MCSCKGKARSAHSNWSGRRVNFTQALESTGVSEIYLEVISAIHRLNFDRSWRAYRSIPVALAGLIGPIRRRGPESAILCSPCAVRGY